MGTDHFEVAQGDAVFLLGGEIGGEPHHLIVTNASAIEIEKDNGVWKSKSFALGYVDSEEDDWTLSIAAARWVAP